MLVAMPGGAVNTCVVWTGALVPRFFPNARIYRGLGLCLVMLSGAILPMTLCAECYEWETVATTWMGACRVSLRSAASIISNNVKGNTKKGIVSIGFFIFFCVGCIVSPLAWTQNDARRYTDGCILSIAALICGMSGYVVYHVLVIKKNKSRDNKMTDGQEESSPAYVEPINQARPSVETDSDYTDIQDKGFRYIL